MRKGKDNFVYLHHISDSINQIFKYLTKNNFDDFIENEWDQAAVMRHLEIIGEASNNLDKDFQEKYSEIPWGVIIGLRNVLIHDYMDIDVDVVWQIITKDLRPLHKQIEKIIKSNS